jgi:thiol-disulfide isomerase/thioredoxin
MRKVLKKVNSVKNLQSFSFLSLLLLVIGVFVVGCLVNLMIGNNKTSLEGMSNQKELNYFYMDGCPHCTAFDPKWDEFKSSYNGSLKLNKIESANAPKSLGISGFPSILIVANGEKKDELQSRTVEALNSMAKKYESS